MPARLSVRRPSVAVNVVLAVALVGGGWWAYRAIHGPSTPKAASAASRTVQAQEGPLTSTVTADGSVASASTASASFVTSGTVTEIDVKVGQLVKKGQVLAKVDPAAAKRSLSAADADLTAADDALTRAKDAGSDTSSAADQVTQAQLAVDDAQAAVTGATLTAPMAGTVTAINGTLGSSSGGSSASSSGSSGTSQSSGGQTGQNGGSSSSSTSSSSSSSSTGFIDLADLTKLQVSAAFAEADATKLKEGQTATVTWNALQSTEQSATLTAVDPQATTSNSVVTYGVTLALDKVPAGAKPGQTVSVTVTTGSVEDAVYVNSAALTTLGNQHFVTVDANGAQERRAVEIGLVGTTSTQITSGLQAGESVVVNTASTTSGSGTSRFGAGGAGGFPAGGGTGGFPGGGTGTGTGTGRTATGGGR
jgi:macrolide-specific efflux system membrane fusion protein